MRIDSIQQKGRIDIITNDQGHCITPSLASFTDEERLIVYAAKNAFHSNLANTAFDAKREHVYYCMISLCKQQLMTTF